MDHLAYNHLWLGVLAPDSSHHEAAHFGRKHIRHSDSPNLNLFEAHFPPFAPAYSSSSSSSISSVRLRLSGGNFFFDGIRIVL